MCPKSNESLTQGDERRAIQNDDTRIILPHAITRRNTTAVIAPYVVPGGEYRYTSTPQGLYLYPGVFTGHDPTSRVWPEGFQNLAGRLRSRQEVLESHG